MTDTPAEAAKTKARQIIDSSPHGSLFYDLATYIQQVSDAASYAIDFVYADSRGIVREQLAPFILPEPVDPWTEALREIPDENIRRIANAATVAEARNRIRAACIASGLKIVKDET